MGATSTLTLTEKPFKQCPMCQLVWETSADFLGDADLRFLGHQKGMDAGDLGMMMFNHSCGTTLSVETEKLHGCFAAEVASAGIDTQDAGHLISLQWLEVVRPRGRSRTRAARSAS